ncbi:hypothetical protein D3C80_634290 [compost metagenome]
MKVYLAIAASPLTDLHLPQTFDTRSLKHHLTNIPELRKGMAKFNIEYDHKGTGEPHKHARVSLETDMGTAYLEFSLNDTNWHYTGESNVNGEVIDYKGHTAHNSVQAICRKVRGLLLKLI